jgi:hypothetical protein
MIFSRNRNIHDIIKKLDELFDKKLDYIHNFTDKKRMTLLIVERKSLPCDIVQDILELLQENVFYLQYFHQRRIWKNLHDEYSSLKNKLKNTDVKQKNIVKDVMSGDHPMDDLPTNYFRYLQEEIDNSYEDIFFSIADIYDRITDQFPQPSNLLSVNIPSRSEPKQKGRFPVRSEPKQKGRFPARSEPKQKGRFPARSEPKQYRHLRLTPRTLPTP